VLFGLSSGEVLLYFLFSISLISISIFVARTKGVSLESYFFANRDQHWSVVGVSFLTPCLFSPYLFGLLFSGITSGMAIIYGIISAIMLVLLGWYLAPLFIKLHLNTLPEFFEKRYNRTTKFFISTLYVFNNIFVRLIIILVIGNLLINTITGADAFTSILFFLVITGIYIIIGGLQAEIYTSIVQILFITLGVIGFSVWLVNQNNGVSLALNKLPLLTYFSLGNSSIYNWIFLILGFPIIGFWFWCADQFMIQKAISIRNIQFAKKASLLSIALQIIPVILFILPGIIFFTLPQDNSSSKTLVSLFSSNILPDSLRGALIITFAAGLIASFASLFNGTSTIITFDFYRSLKPSASESELVLVGRLTTMFLMFCSILLIPIAQTFNLEICLKLFKTFSYFASMITAVLIIGLINPKIKAVCANSTLFAGTFIIILKPILEIFYENSHLGNSLIYLFIKSNFLEFSVFIFIISVFLLFIINYLEKFRPVINPVSRIFSFANNKIKSEWNFLKGIITFLFVFIILIVWWVGIILI
jgi:solute:Na+ symporter, SSS family